MAPVPKTPAEKAVDAFISKYQDTVDAYIKAEMKYRLAMRETLGDIGNQYGQKPLTPYDGMPPIDPDSVVAKQGVDEKYVDGAVYERSLPYQRENDRRWNRISPQQRKELQRLGEEAMTEYKKFSGQVEAAANGWADRQAPNHEYPQWIKAVQGMREEITSRVDRKIDHAVYKQTEIQQNQLIAAMPKEYAQLREAVEKKTALLEKIDSQAALEKAQQDGQFAATLGGYNKIITQQLDAMEKSLRSHGVKPFTAAAIRRNLEDGMNAVPERKLEERADSERRQKEWEEIEERKRQARPMIPPLEILPPPRKEEDQALRLHDIHVDTLQALSASPSFGGARPPSTKKQL